MTTSNKPLKITVAHINDTHSHFEPHPLQLDLTIDGRTLSPYVSAGGFARIATRAKQIKEMAARQDRAFMLFHAGDCFQGTLYFSLFKGKANADLLNALNIDAMALGNHELDMGNRPVAEFLDRVCFPVLAGNWDISNELPNKNHSLKNKANLYSYQPESRCASWITKEVEGESIAVFGVSMDQMAAIANPDPDTGFADTFETVKNTVTAIRAKGVNKIILLSHLGFEADVELAKQIKGIALIIGGHSHTLQGDFRSVGMGNGGEYGVDVNGTRIVQSGFHAQAIGHCEIDFDADGSVSHFKGKNELLFGRRLCIDVTLSTENTDVLHAKAVRFLQQNDNVVICKKDPDVNAVLRDKYIPRVRTLQQTIIGKLARPLRHVRLPDEKGGSEIVPLVAESFYHSMQQYGYDVEFAIHNAGAVRTSLNPGTISVADIAGKLLPFAVPVGVYTIKGKYIALALEGAINNALNNGVNGTGTGSYPYSYNLDFSYHPDNEPGHRITDLKIRNSKGKWQAVQQEQLYCGTSSAYTIKGKEGYTALTKMADPAIITQLSMTDCFIEFLKNQTNKMRLLN